MIGLHTLAATWFVSLPHETIIMFAYFSFRFMFQFRSGKSVYSFGLVMARYVLPSTILSRFLHKSKYLANFCYTFFGVLCVCNGFFECFSRRSFGADTAHGQILRQQQQ